jgi:hypothetical protein
MDVHVRIGDNRIFALKQAVLLYQEGNRAFATVHDVKHSPNEAPYLCASQSVTTGLLETLAKGLGASMAAEFLPEYVLARTPELIALWIPPKTRLMFFGNGDPKTRDLMPRCIPIHRWRSRSADGSCLFVRSNRTVAPTLILA